MFRLFYTIQDYFSKYERHMRKARKFYNKPFKEETYDLDSVIIEFLYSRLSLFLEDSSRVVDWDADIEHKKVKDNIPIILSNFKFYLDNRESTDLDIWTESNKKAKEGLVLLSQIFSLLGW